MVIEAARFQAGGGRRSLFQPGLHVKKRRWLAALTTDSRLHWFVEGHGAAGGDTMTHVSVMWVQG